MTKLYDPADAVVIDIDIADVDGNPVDPATLVISLADPTQVETVITVPDSRVSHPTTGTYSLTLLPPVGGHLPGAWQWRVVTTLPYLEEPGVFVVRPRAF